MSSDRRKSSPYGFILPTAITDDVRVGSTIRSLNSRGEVTVPSIRARAIALIVAALAACLVLAPPVGAKKNTRVQQAKAPSLLDPATAPLAGSNGPLPSKIEGQVIVRFMPGTSAATRAKVHRKRGAHVVQKLLLSNAEVVAIDPTRDEKKVAAAYERSPFVDYAEPNLRFRLSSTYPGDTLFGEQWGLDNIGQTANGVAGANDADIDAPEAWDEDFGSPNVVVGVADSGVETSHSELTGLLWSNAGESGGGRETNAVDDDLNGFVDDWRGWDFADADNDANDPNGHGTYIAGIIGADTGSGQATAGVAPGVKLAPLRICSVDILGDQCTAASIANAFTYAGQNGMKVVSAAISGQTAGAQIVKDAVDASPGTLFVVPSGNGGPDGAGDDNEFDTEYPCSHPSPNILCVAATDQQDKLASFSNYGSQSVDLAAPGVNVLSTWKGGQVAYQSGTSASTGFAAGAAALVWSRAIEQTVSAVKSRLMSNVDSKATLSGKTVTGGRLNVAKALPPSQSQAPGSADPSWNNGSIVTTDFDPFFGEVPHAVDVQTDGKTVAGGLVTPNCDFGLARYLGDGSLDPSFGNGGKVTTDLSGNATCDNLNALKVAPDGKIIAAGVLGASEQDAIVRYLPNGSLDPSFDGDGKAIGNAGPFHVQDIEVDSAGRITAVGLTGGSGDFKLMRLLADGSLDPSFGVVTTDFGGNDTAWGVASLGTSLGVVGQSGARLAMAVYDQNGNLDTGFSGDGKLTLSFGGTSDGGQAIAKAGNSWVVGGRADSNNNGSIAVASDRDGNRDIWVSRADGSGAFNMTATSSDNNDWPSFDPYPGAGSVRTIAFGSNRDGDYDIYTMYADGTGSSLQQLTTGAGSEFADIHPDFSPAGGPSVSSQSIAFASTRAGGGYDVYKMDGSGGSLLRLTTAAGDDFRPTWSPDGVSIAFESSRDGNTEIYTMNADGTGQLNRSSNSASDTAPSWSPDGTKIAFRSTRSPAGIYTMDANGSNQTRVPNTTVSDMAPAWSPDGSKLVISNTSDTFTIDVDGNNRQQITSTDAFPHVEPDWQPLGGFALARIGTNGTLDTTFSGDGKLVTQSAGAADVRSVGVQTLSAGSHKLVTVGSSQADSVPPFSAAELTLARYNDDGTTDTGFGTGGQVRVPSFYDVGGMAGVVTPGKVTSVGYNGGGFFAVARHLLGGQPNIAVSPSSGLNPNGQTVSVSGSGFEPNDSLEISQCKDSTCSVLTTATSNSSGQLSSTNVSVNYTVQGAAADCPDGQCLVKVSSTTTQQEASSSISFTTPATLEVSPSAGSIALGQAITLGESVTLNAVAGGTSGAGSPLGDVNFFWCGPIASPATCSGGTALAGNPKPLAASGAFTGPTTFPAGQAARSIAVADFNGDSDSDLAVVNASSQNVSILLGSAGGGFTAPTNYSAGAGPDWVASGDFNGDSDPDLAVTNINSDNVSILLGGPGGTFTGPTDFAVGSQPRPVAVGEFNGDSDPDLAVGNLGSNNVSILMGGAGGSFTAPVNYASGGAPQSIAVGNFDADSFIDLAVANSSSNNVSILLGGAGGSFTGPNDFGVGLGPVSVAVGDFNGDSDPDLAAANISSDNVSILLGSAGGSFTGPTDFATGQQPNGVAVDDFDGDSHDDLAIVNFGDDDVSILLGGSGTSFTPRANIPVGNGPLWVTTGDFNGDSDSDLAVGQQDLPNAVSILLGAASNTATATSDPFTPASAGRYCFQVTYSGDEDYRPASDSGRPSCISVRQPASSLQAVSDFYRTPADGTLVVPPAGLLQNDVYPSNATVSASQETNDANPLHGSVFINSDGSFTYIPEPGYIGPDDFTYTATQSPGGATSQATVTLDVTEQVDPLQGTRNRGTRNRGTRNRGTRNRELDRVGMEVFSDCHTRWVSINPQVTIPHPGVVKVTARLKDAAGNEIIGSDYLVNDEFYGDPFAPTVLTWPTWNSPAPAGGAYVDVLIEVDPDSTEVGDEYEDTATVLCAT